MCDDPKEDSVVAAMAGADVASIGDTESSADKTMTIMGDDGRPIKTCKLCGASCWDQTCLVAESPLQVGWNDQLPWYHGTVGNPVGRFCKVCVNSYQLVLFSKEGPLKQYVKAITVDPARHSDTFPQVREQWVQSHNANPMGRVNAKSMMQAQVLVGSRQSDEMEGPEEEFVTEYAWAAEVYDRTGQRPRRADHPELKWEQRHFRGVSMWGYRERIGRSGRYKLRKTDATYVDRANRLHDGEELQAGEAESKANLARESVLAKASDMASLDFEGMLRLMGGQTKDDEEELSGAEDDVRMDEALEAANPLQAHFLKSRTLHLLRIPTQPWCFLIG